MYQHLDLIAAHHHLDRLVADADRWRLRRQLRASRRRATASAASDSASVGRTLGDSLADFGRSIDDADHEPARSTVRAYVGDVIAVAAAAGVTNLPTAPGAADPLVVLYRTAGRLGAHPGVSAVVVDESAWSRLERGLAAMRFRLAVATLDTDGERTVVRAARVAPAA